MGHHEQNNWKIQKNSQVTRVTNKIEPVRIPKPSEDELLAGFETVL